MSEHTSDYCYVLPPKIVSQENTLVCQETILVTAVARSVKNCYNTLVIAILNEILNRLLTNSKEQLFRADQFTVVLNKRAFGLKLTN